MENIKLHDKEFRPFIDAVKIDEAIARIAKQINKDLKDKQPLFLSILNGSFMFTSDLLKLITIPGTEVSFVKIASYAGISSTGEVKELIGLKEDLSGRTVVIVEDMIDSGKSMMHLIEFVKQKNPAHVVIVTMFFKPKALVCPVAIDYCCLELGNDFVVGRGLDYNGLGRNYPDLYILNT